MFVFREELVLVRSVVENPFFVVVVNEFLLRLRCIMGVPAPTVAFSRGGFHFLANRT